MDITYLQQTLSNVQLIAPTFGVLVAIALTIILLIASGIASGSEIAFFSLSPSDLNELDADRSEADRSLVDLRDDNERTLATILITNNFVNVTIIMLCNYIFSSIVDFGDAYWLEFLSITVLLTFLLLLFGEIMPKIFARQNPLNFCRHLAGTILVLRRLFWPLSSVLIRSGIWASKVVQKEAHVLSVDDLEQADVDLILGADDSYSLVRFQVGIKGNVVIPVVSSVQPMKSTVYVLKRAENGTMESVQATVADTAMIQGKYAYYTLDQQVDESLIGAPVFNASGVLMGILHAQIAGRSHVLDIRFSKELKVAAFSSSSAAVALNNIYIPKALPDTPEEALVYLYAKSRSADNEEYMDMVNRFIAAYPNNAEGYPF